MPSVETENLFPCPQQAITGCCHQTVESSPHPHTLYFFKIRFNIILPSTPTSLPFTFSHQNFVCISHFPLCIPFMNLTQRTQKRSTGSLSQKRSLGTAQKVTETSATSRLSLGVFVLSLISPTNSLSLLR